MPDVRTMGARVRGTKLRELHLDGAPTPPPPAGSARLGALTAALVAVAALPIVVALVALRQPRWYPVWDLATTELQLRDVGSIHTPLTGVGGLLGVPPDPQGSHPGPLGFYALTPVYRVLGSSAWAMQAATAVMHLAAVGVCLWLVSRRKSVPLLVGTGAALIGLTYTYGPEVLTQAWAPYMDLMWWFTFVVAVWCVVCDDLPVLPVLIFAGSFCVQNHSSAVLPVTALTALAFGSVAVVAYRRRRDRSVVVRAVRWSAIALTLGVVLWIPPLLDQLVSDKGNLGILWRHFRGWNEHPMGIRESLEMVLLHLSPWRMATRDLFIDHWTVSGSLIPGALTLAAWGASAIAALRFRLSSSLLRFHGVVAAMLVATVLTVSRLGFAWYYRLMWLWSVAALVILATGWTGVVLARRVLRRSGRSRAADRVVWVPAAVAVVFTAILAVSAVDAGYDRRDSEVLARLAADVDAALDRDDRADDEVLLVWNELTTGSLGRGLMNELVRRGLEVRAPDEYRAEVRPHRTATPDEVDTAILLVGGGEVGRVRRDPNAREIAHAELVGADEAVNADESGGTSVFLVPPATLDGG